MVYIKRLAIQGFKSFGPRRISIDLEKGFIVVTGPNGGGKSNVLDSIRFTLGELSAHNLRVGRMAELVHDEPSINWARTTLTFDNSQRVLPVDSEDVTISRKISKTGESEYYVNGRQVSRNELLTILSMANIKPSGFNIVPQGSVIEIAEMSGSDHRKMLEEVAGISGYEKKKAEAEEQLAIAEKNLAIAKASTKEVKVRVKQLEKERNQAFRRSQVEEFLNAIKRLKLGKNIKSLEKELKEIDEQLLEHETQLEKLETERTKLLEEKSNLNIELDQSSRKLDEVEAELGKLRSQKSVIESKVNDLRIELSVMKERAEGVLKEKAYILERLSLIDQRISELQDEIEKMKENALNLSETLKLAEDKAGKTFEELKQVETKYQTLKKKIDEEKKRIESEILKWKTELTRADAKAKELQKSIAEIYSEIEELAKSLGESFSKILETWRRIRMIEMEELSLRGEMRELEKRFKKSSSELSLIEEHERKLSAILEKIASTGILRESNGNEEIIQAIRSAGLSGVRGFLKDGVTADDDILQLIDSATDGWLRSLVVDSWDIGMALAELFGELGISVKIISLDIASAQPKRIRLPKITFKEKWAEVALSYLLKDVKFTGKLEPIEGKKLVLNNVLIHPDLKIESISFDKTLLAEAITKEYKESVKLLRKLRERIADTEENFKAINEKLREKEKLLAKINFEKKTLYQKIWDLYSNISENLLKENRQVSKLNKLKRELRENEEIVKVSRENLSLITARESELKEEDLRLLERELLKKRELYEEAKLEHVELKAKLGNVRRRIDDLKVEFERLIDEKSKLKSRIETVEKEHQRASERSGQIEVELKSLEEELAQITSNVNELTNVRSSLKYDFEKTSQALKSVISRLEEIEEKIQKISSTKSSIQVRRAQLEIQLGNLREKIATIGESSIELPEVDESLLSKLERELEEELKELEMINQLAPAQYEELAGNYKVRSSRIMELEAERQEILKFIEWVESEKKRIFMETFNRVADAFEDYFTKLTGGRGWLRLENPDDPFQGGVEMVLAFPGKQPRSVRAASGGEKSVAAVAFLLALQGLTPADFYIFDEVDAHMDLQYTRRLAELFKEMAKRTQIIVISLKDVMVEKADQVIGVYNSGGVSKIVKTRLEEVVRGG